MFLVGRLHVSMVVAVTALTVFSMGTWLHDAHAKLPAKVSPSTTPAAGSLHPSGATITTTGSNKIAASSGTGTGWTTADLSKLVGIATQLFSSLTPSDLASLATDMRADPSNSSVKQSTDEHVMQVIQDHLSATDLAWVESHFTGSQAFSANDVQLLQQTFSEVATELTPAEQQWVTQGMQGFLSGQSLK
jgi:hypothetical protein